jgi:hypothetical protein
MKVQITFKDPDVVLEGIEDAVRKSLGADRSAWSLLEYKAIFDARLREVHEKVGKWLRYGEYVDVEVDTDADTCVVIKP